MMKQILTALLLVLTLQAEAGFKYDFIVAQDGSGQYKTIQEAVNACTGNSLSQITIFVKKGIYTEKLIIPPIKTNIAIIGEDKMNTIITYNDYSGKGALNTFTSYTVMVQGDGFYAQNITFENSAGPVGQAVALHIDADKVILKNCRLIGNQDTLFTGKDGSRQYFEDCYIEGTTDFIFGPATAVFQRCLIYSKKNSYITAASTPENTPFGYVFFNCKLTADLQFKKIYLGRPWRPFAKTVFISTEMGDHILPEGWHNWNKPDAEKTSFYAEYGSKGPGANPAKRVAWSKQLTSAALKAYTLANIFPGWKITSTIAKYKAK